MSRARVQVSIALGLYLVFTLGPLALAAAGSTHGGRGFWVEFSCALGFVGFAMMGAQFALTARFRWLALRFGQDTMLHFHRQAGVLAFVFVAAHPIIAIVAEPSYLAFFDPRVNMARAGALSSVTVALVLLVGMPMCRRRLGLPYEWWRVTHGLLALYVILVGLAHILMVNHLIATLWKQAVWVGLTTGAVALLAHVRLVKPVQMLRRPWRVTGVRAEVNRAWTLTLEPVGHGGFAFHPGQFVWLTLRDSPFTLQQHPFSISSSAERRDAIDLTIKELGDFTSGVGRTAPGRRAFLEGPYGSFTIDAAPDATAFVFIAGGIGITPIVSMIRTMADREDARPVTLVYAVSALENVVFRDELRSLAERVALRVVYALERRPDEALLDASFETWSGEAGMLTGEVLARCLPEGGAETLHCFVCGPEPMMDVAERALLGRGTARSNIHSERFNIV